MVYATVSVIRKKLSLSVFGVVYHRNLVAEMSFCILILLLLQSESVDAV
jgi:hypothetical protein